MVDEPYKTPSPHPESGVRIIVAPKGPFELRGERVRLFALPGPVIGTFFGLSTAASIFLIIRADPQLYATGLTIQAA